MWDNGADMSRTNTRSTQIENFKSLYTRTGVCDVCRVGPEFKALQSAIFREEKVNVALLNAIIEIVTNDARLPEGE